MLAPWKKSCNKAREHIKNHFADKYPYSQSCGFSSSHVQMWELDHKEAWVLKNWRFWIVVLEKTLESSLDSKEIKTVNPKGNQSWIFIRRTNAETEVTIFGYLMQRTNSLEKTLTLEMTESRKRRRWQRMRWFDGIIDSAHEFEQAPGDGEGQGSLACCSPWGHKELDMTERLNWRLFQYNEKLLPFTEKNLILHPFSVFRMH